MENKRRFVRSRKNRQLAGVCAGLSDYFNFDVSLMRVLFVVAALCGSFGLWLYIILWIVVPEEQPTIGFDENEHIDNIDVTDNERKRGSNGAIVVSVVLIAVGLMALANNFLCIDWVWKMWPLILIALGVLIIINSQKK